MAAGARRLRFVQAVRQVNDPCRGCSLITHKTLCMYLLPPVKTIGLWALLIFITGCTAQPARPPQTTTRGTGPVGGPCEGCELLWQGMPSQPGGADTSMGWHQPGAQRLLVTGRVLAPDGKTPAAGVILYYWHTNHQGVYAANAHTPKAAMAHGALRGWVKTGPDGRYAIYTRRPAPYPGEKIPAHIHFVIKEPELSQPYYPDDLVFDDDPLLLPELKKNPPPNRCGSGIVRLLQQEQLWVAERDFVLGLHIPHHPARHNSIHGLQSGLPIGHDQPSFTPYHAWGPDKGTRACPVCKYGRYQGILYFVNQPKQVEQIKQWLLWLEAESLKRQGKLKVYLVYAHPQNNNKTRLQLEQWGRQLGLRHLALSLVPSFTDTQTEVHLNQINPQAENTFIIYRNRRIVDKYVNLPSGPTGFATLAQAPANTAGEYLHLPAMHNQ